MTPPRITLSIACLFCGLLAVSSVILTGGCTHGASPIPKDDEQTFHQYWSQGKAEINRYTLQQSRYGATYPGTAVLIFVTEDFSRTKHVKLEEPDMHKNDAVRIMKLNAHKEFVTGIYSYSMMNSVFTPLDVAKYPRSFKLTSSVQEWCGQSFIQFNWKGNRYEMQQMSYFEHAGDAKFSMANGWLEDEIWNKIRVAPNTLPIGEVKLIPSAFYLRLTHTETKVYPAVTNLQQQDSSFTYTVEYPDLKRTLSISFETAFPHRILGWTEKYGENEVTTGTLDQTLQTDYWKHNQPQDTLLRQQLHLSR